jgi:CubicO group peptidase (beta-lactamase class C family)
LLRRFAAAAVLAALTASAPATARAPSAQPFERAAAMDTHMPGLLKRHGAAGAAVAVIRSGRVAWTGYYGEQAPGVPVTAGTLFNAASLAKPVAAETILRLAAEGRLTLDEPMSRHWIDPDLKDDPRHAKLTPAIALSHRTGFPNWRFADAGKTLRFGSDPGAKEGYSGEGYDYVARFAEKKLGTPFEELVRTRVFEPVGMWSAGLTRRDWMSGRVATPMDEKGAWGEPDLRDPGQWSAADNLFVTVEDYAAFVISVGRDERLTPPIAAERRRIHTPVDTCMPGTEHICPRPGGHALGWMVLTFDGRPMLWHDGGDWGEKSMAYIYPDTDDGLVIFVNGGAGRPVIRDALEVLRDPSPLAANFRAFEAAQKK